MKNRYLTDAAKLDIVTILMCLAVILIVKLVFFYEEPTVEVDPVYMEDVASSNEDLGEFVPGPGLLGEPLFLDIPPLGLTIEGGEPPCVDSHLRTEVSCADKEAILKYRNALQDEEVKRLKLKIEKLEKENHYKEFGLREC